MHTAIVVLVVIVVALGVGIALWYVQGRRSEKLRERFGPEYERAVDEMGNRRRAEEVLEKREKRVERLRIRPLGAADRQRFADSWREVQAQFVDNPTMAVTNADQLVNEVMASRGYPVADWSQRAADLSVDHPRVIENYRAARNVATRSHRGEADTEDLRHAIVYYRRLFEELLDVPSAVHTEVNR